MAASSAVVLFNVAVRVPASPGPQEVIVFERTFVPVMTLTTASPGRTLFAEPVGSSE